MPTVLTDQEVLDLVRQRFPGDEARILAAIGSQAAILRAQLADNGGGIIGVTPPAGYTSETLNALLAELAADIGAGGVTDHGALTGLADDDHPQYLNQARGDARYSQLGHTHAIASVTGLPAALDGKLDDSQASAAGLAVLGAADAAAQRTALGLGTAATQASSAFQAADPELAAIAGVTGAADRLFYFTGAGAGTLATFTAFGRSLVDDADASAARGTLGGTTIGASIFTLANPGAVRYLRVNANNTATAITAGDMRAEIGGLDILLQAQGVL